MTTTFLQAVPPTYGDGGVMMWGMLIAMFAIMYFFMIRPQNKKRKAIENFRKTLQVNQKVVTAGGIYGHLKEVTDSYVILEIAKGVQIRVDKNSIYEDIADANQQQAAK